MLIVSWNLAGRVRRLDEQAERVRQLDADIVCLQELSAGTLGRWLALLGRAGYAGLVHARMPSREERARGLAVLTACRGPLLEVPIADAPWPERVLAVRTAGGLEVLNVHSPISDRPELAKVRTHEAVWRHLARTTASPRVLCGDLNTPRREHPDGTIWTFARDRYGRLREDRGEDTDRAELLLLEGLWSYGFRDAFRELHGSGTGELSWEWPRRGGGYRLDHLLCAEMTAEYCFYEHSWRYEGLSDHSALIARLRPRSLDAAQLA